MNWMVKWAGAFPPIVREAQGAHFYDIDGHRYVDFCLGDTGAMTGHSPFATAKGHRRSGEARHHAHAALRRRRLRCRGIAATFGLTYWQFALTATDANRFAIRLARQITGRPKILVFNWLLPRHGRRNLHHPSSRRHFRTAGAGNVGRPSIPP